MTEHANDTKAREIALDQAVRTRDSTKTATDLVETAEKFYKFLVAPPETDH